MQKLNGTMAIEAKEDMSCIEIIDLKSDTVQDRIYFEDSHDFCRFLLELARDMGLTRMEFASACNKAVNEVEEWDNL